MDKTEFESSFSKFLEYTRNSYSSNLPTWYRDYSRTSLSRNITINTWNDLVDLIKKTSSDINTITDFLKDVKEFVSTITVGGGGGGGGSAYDDGPIRQLIQEEAVQRTAADNALQNQLTDTKANAVGLPTYNKSDGTLTFKTLGGKEGDPIPLGSDTTLPAWNTSLEEPDNWQVPPTTEAIVNYIESMMSSGGSGGSSSAVTVPLQVFSMYKEYTGFVYDFTNVGNKSCAKIYADTGSLNCASYHAQHYTPSSNLNYSSSAIVMVEAYPCVLRTWDSNDVEASAGVHFIPIVTLDTENWQYTGGFSVRWVRQSDPNYYFYNCAFDYFVEVETTDAAEYGAPVLHIKITPVNVENNLY